MSDGGGDVVYVSTERERGPDMRRLSARGERPRSTGQFLTTATAATGARGREEVVDGYGYVEPSRQNVLFLEDRDGDAAGLRARSRSITYATTGPRLSRERVLVEEGGRVTRSLGAGRRGRVIICKHFQNFGYCILSFGLWVYGFRFKHIWLHNTLERGLGNWVYHWAPLGT